MEDLAVFTALNHSGSFGKNFVKLKNLLTITFLTVYLMNRGKSTYINRSSMRVNNTFR